MTIPVGGMPNIRRAIESFFEDTATALYPNIPIHWQNTQISPPEDKNTLWMRASLDETDTARLCVGVRQYRTEGQFIVQIFSPLQIGTAIPETVADALARMLSDKHLDDFVWMRATSVVPVGESDGWYQHNMITDFQADFLR